MALIHTHWSVLFLVEFLNATSTNEEIDLIRISIQYACVNNHLLQSPKVHHGLSHRRPFIYREISVCSKKGKMSIFTSFFARYLPTVEASDEELVDPQKQLREECSALPKCSNFQEKLNTCNDRVNSRKKTAEICLEELFDYMHCVDHCVAKTLFSKLK